MVLCCYNIAHEPTNPSNYYYLQQKFAKNPIRWGVKNCISYNTLFTAKSQKFKT